jgi:hypothetical protein
MALRLAKLFRTSPEFRLTLQRNVDRWDAAREIKREIAHIHPGTSHDAVRGPGTRSRRGHPVKSRADYLENMRSRELSEAEIDERHARYMESMRTLDRSERDDRIGFAAMAFQFDA